MLCFWKHSDGNKGHQQQSWLTAVIAVHQQMCQPSCTPSFGLNRVADPSLLVALPHVGTTNNKTSDSATHVRWLKLPNSKPEPRRPKHMSCLDVTVWYTARHMHAVNCKQGTATRIRYIVYMYILQHTVCMAVGHSLTQGRFYNCSFFQFFFWHQKF